jgi:FkbM family methyltransferase
MRQRLGLRRMARLAARQMGLDVRPFNPMLNAATRLARVCEHQAVTLVVDVGASGGEWATSLRLGGYNGRLVSYEPQAVEFSKVATRAADDPLWVAHRLAIGRDERELSLSVSRDSRWSSFLPLLIRNGQSDVVGEERVRTVRLDVALGDVVTADDRVFLKLDVQGFEMEVLAGAPILLPQVVAAYVEVILAPLYAGQPSREELFSALESAGLRLAGVESGYIGPDNGEELYFDALFVRD